MSIRSAFVLCLALSSCTGSAGETQVDLLVRELASGATPQRRIAARKLGDLGPTAAPAVSELINATQSSLTFKEEHAAELSPENEGNPKRAILRDSFLDLCSLHADAIEALGRIGPAARDAAPILLEELITSRLDLPGNALKRVVPSATCSINEMLAFKELAIIASAEDSYMLDRKRQGQPPAFSPMIGGRNGFLSGSRVHESAEGVPGKATPLNGYLFRVLSLNGARELCTAKARDEMKNGYGLIAYPNAYDEDGHYTYVLVKKLDSDFEMFRKNLAGQTAIGDDWKTEIDSTWSAVSAKTIENEIKADIASALAGPPPPPDR